MTLERPAAALAGGAGVSICTAPAASVAEKVAFLSRPDAYPHRADEVVVRETHMSWVFLAGPRAYKLKKPVRFPYLDFSTLARREAACRAELKLNRRLAGDVYVDVIPLTAVRHRLSLAGSGAVVDWLVVMRRLDERCMLDHAIAAKCVDERALDRLVTLLARFYQHAARVRMTGEAHLADWRKSLADNRRGLFDPRAQLPAGLVCVHRWRPGTVPRPLRFASRRACVRRPYRRRAWRFAAGAYLARQPAAHHRLPRIQR